MASTSAWRAEPAKFSTLARVNPVTFETAQGLSITYAGPPSACVIRSVSGVPIDDSDLLMLKDPEKFEAFAWDIERQLKSCEGLVRRDGAGGRFRENAFVLERGGFWVPYTQYEARLTTLLLLQKQLICTPFWMQTHTPNTFGKLW